MTFGIDCRFWNQTGIGRYTRNLVSNLYLQDKKNKYVLFALSEDLEEIRAMFPNKKWRIVKANFKWHTFEEQTQFAIFLNSQKIDLMHFPYFSVPYLYRKKYVVTIHDLIINKFNTGTASTLPYPIYRVKRAGYNLILRNAISKSLKIIVPSVSVKNDLVQVYKKLNPEKIVVTYEAGFESNYESVKSKIDSDYILRVGNFYPHKNLDNLLEAFKSIKMKDLKLVMVGKKDFFYKNILEKIDKLNLSKKVVFIETPNDEKLYSLYKNAKATIIPSFLEGFSLTAVEAMSVGCPVILSDISVHREICKDGGVYFDPNNILDIKEKIENVLSLSEVERNDLVRKEVLISEKYSWKKMAAQTLQVYESSTRLR